MDLWRSHEQLRVLELGDRLLGRLGFEVDMRNMAFQSSPVGRSQSKIVLMPKVVPRVRVLRAARGFLTVAKKVGINLLSLLMEIK